MHPEPEAPIAWRRGSTGPERFTTTAIARSISCWLISAWLLAAAATAQTGAAEDLPSVDPATDYVREANLLYRDVPASRAGHNELLRGLLDLKRPPASADTPDKAALLSIDAASWPAVELWAQDPGSRRALSALAAFTEGRQYEEVKIFAQPYGPEGVPAELLEEGLYTELGSPPILAAAQHGYLTRLDWLRSLVHAEVARLVADGEIDAAYDELIRLVVLGRQIADRHFFAEAVWGLETMIDALRRARDVGYVDFNSARELSIGAIDEMIGVLESDAGVIVAERLTFPAANKIASRQLVAEMYEPGDGPDTGFGLTAARLQSSGRPLRRFGAVGSAQERADDQLGWDEIIGEIKAVFGDWEKRWTLGAFDPLLQQPSAYATFERGPRAAVFLAARSRLHGRAVSGDDLFELRRVFEAERVGTRIALAVVGRTRVVGQHPPTLPGVRPRFVRQIDPDPYNPNRDRGARPEPRYFPPDEGDALPARPERMTVRARGETLEIDVRPEDFILYSVGTDGDDDLAEDVGESPRDGGDDLLFWPPAISLLRAVLEESGPLR